MKTISFLSQKGGVGKSTLARAVATEAAKSGLFVMLADLDTQQGTIIEWHRQRVNNGYASVGNVKAYETAIEAIKEVDGEFDMLVIDGAPRASTGTLEAARYSDLIILPCCASRDDLIPGMQLAHDLQEKGIAPDKIVFALVRVSTTAEVIQARGYIQQSGFTVLDGCLHEKTSYRNAQNKGLAVTETAYKSLNTKADILMESILKYLKRASNG